MFWMNWFWALIQLTCKKIGDEGAFAFAIILKENCSLKNLDLKMNKLTDQSASKILKALRKNNFMESLDLSTNELGAEVF